MQPYDVVELLMNKRSDEKEKEEEDDSDNTASIVSVILVPNTMINRAYPSHRT